MPTIKINGKLRKVSAARAQQYRANHDPLYDPMTNLSGNQLRKAAQKITDLEYKPQLQAYDRASAQTRRQGTALMGNAGDYYRGIAEEAQKGLTRQQALNGLSQQRIQAAGDAAQQRIGAAGQQIAADQAADQGVRGSGLSGGADRATEELGAARGVAANRAQTEQMSGALMSQSGEGLLNEMAQARNMRGGEVQDRLGNRMANELADIRAKRTGLATERGDAFTKNLLTLRDKGTENAIAQAGIMGDKAALQQKADEAAKSRRAASRLQARAAKDRAALQDDSQTFTAGQNDKNRSNAQLLAKMRAASKGKGKGSGSTDMPASARTLRTGVDNAVLLGKTPKMIVRGDVPGTAKKLRKAGASPLVAQAGAEVAILGFLSPNTQAALKRAGVVIPKRWATPRSQTQDRPT